MSVSLCKGVMNTVSGKLILVWVVIEFIIEHKFAVLAKMLFYVVNSCYDNFFTGGQYINE